MKKHNGRLKWFMIYTFAFILAFVGSVVVKMTYTPSWSKNYMVQWSEKVGTIHKDIAYGTEESNKFDLYLPSNTTKNSYGLVVYLHAGGFATGDKKDDKEMLQWLASKGYVAAGINYTLRNENNPKASVYTQSLEIKKSIPKVIEIAQELGYNIDKMALSGGSAGHTLAMIYAYRDGKEAPVPVTMLFGAVGPSSFYNEDWSNYGLNKDDEETRKAAADLFGVMAGKTIEPEILGTNKYDEEIKDISALLWIDENTVPSLLAYGKFDKVQPFEASKRLNKRLENYNVPHDYLVFEHSGHGLQNDSKMMKLYYEKIEDYLEKYLPTEE